MAKKHLVRGGLPDKDLADDLKYELKRQFPGIRFKVVQAHFDAAESIYGVLISGDISDLALKEIQTFAGKWLDDDYSVGETLKPTLDQLEQYDDADGEGDAEGNIDGDDRHDDASKLELVWY